MIYQKQNAANADMEVQEIKNKTMKKYKIELTEYQLKVLSSVINKQARLIFGNME